jgi:hypothetical protein
VRRSENKVILHKTLIQHGVRVHNSVTGPHVTFSSFFVAHCFSVTLFGFIRLKTSDSFCCLKAISPCDLAMADLSERKKRKRSVSSKLPPIMLQELQSAAMNYLRPHVTDAVADIEMLPAGSYVLISNAVDPDRPVEETRTGQTLKALAARGMSVFDWPLYGFQAHQEARHAYVAPLPVRKALEALLIELHVAERLRTCPLQFWVAGAFPRKIVQPWDLPTVAFTPHVSEVFRIIEGVHTTLSTKLHGVIPLENFTEAIKSAQVTPLQRVNNSCKTFDQAYNELTMGQKLFMVSSQRYRDKMQRDSAVRAVLKSKRSSSMRARWMIAKFREAMRKALLGNKVMKTLWQKQWFVDMKRAWYDDPVNRAMFRENGRQTLAKLRQRPEWVSKIAAIHSARLRGLWEKSRDVMLSVLKLGRQSFAQKLRDPEWYAAFVARKHDPVRFDVRVQAAALEKRGTAYNTRYEAGLVEALVRKMTEHFPEEGLFEFSWRLMTAYSYADTLLAKLSAGKPDDTELRILIQRIRTNAGLGAAVWDANVDVVVLKRMYESASGFTPATLAILNASPTRELAVMRALGIDRKKTSLGENAKQTYGIAEHGLKILTEEFPHIPASRKAHACAKGTGVEEIRALVARFEGKSDYAFESREVDGKPDGIFCKACQRAFRKTSMWAHSRGPKHMKAVQSMRAATGESMPSSELAVPPGVPCDL